MIDLHSHVLPGMDDGVRTIEEAVELARTAEEQGITQIAATPHVRDDWPDVTADAIARAVAQVNDALRREGVDVQILPGGEIALDRLPSLRDDELARFGLGGNAKLLLLEFPYYGWPLELGDIVFRLRTRGVVPLLAHPERNPDVMAAPERLRPFVDAGAYVQLTAASVDGRLGRTVQASARRLLELELAHVLASDAHHPGIRAAGMRAAVHELGDRPLARWLTTEVPRALLAGEDPPPRPVSHAATRPGLLRRILGG